MRADWSNQYFREREARLGDEIARRALPVPRPPMADPSLQPSTGPTLSEFVAHASKFPGPRSKTRRSITATGATSFHIRVTSVVASDGAQAPDGSRSSSDRAARHQIYIERPAAVERLTPAIPRIVDLPQQQAYIERQQAVEQANEIIASFGNLGGTTDQREAFWAAVAESAHPARNYAVATCSRNREPAFWRAVSDDPTAPACLKALEGPGPHKLKFKTEAEAAPVIAFADSHGEIGPDAKSERAIVFNPGRAARIQTRLIIELPYELTPKQRLKLAKRICRALFGPQIRYWAAIHAPDAHNDSRNFHLHVVFWDRPTRKIRDKSGQRVWDFTILELHEDSENHNKRWCHPYRQHRDRTFSARNWIKQTRERVAEFVNDALTEAGAERRVDPRRYSEMGIDREPEPRAPGWAYSLEKRGVETAAARPAVEVQWRRARQRLSRQYDNFQPDADIAARFDSALRRAPELTDTAWRLDALTAGARWRSAVERLNAAEADAAALEFTVEKIRSRLAPPIETGDGRANRAAFVGLVATINAELLAEIRQQGAVAARAEARALETLAKLEKELGDRAEQVRLGGEIEAQSQRLVSAPDIAVNDLVDGATGSLSTRSVADDEPWTFIYQYDALRARALAVAGSSALAYSNLNDIVAAGQQRASPTQFDDLDLAGHGSLPLPMTGTAPQSRSAPDVALDRQLDQRRTQETATSVDADVALAAGALALSAASAAADCELASTSIALPRQRQATVVEFDLPSVDSMHSAVDAADRLHALNIVATSGSAEASAHHEPRHHEIWRQLDIVAADQSLAVAADALALRTSGAALAAELTEHDAYQTHRQRAATAEATTGGVAHLQTDPISSTLPPIPPSIADETEQWRRRQWRRDRQCEQDFAAGGEDLASRARALALSSSASLAELAIAADETSLNLARRAAYTTGQAIVSAQHEPSHPKIPRQSDIVRADQDLAVAARTLALRASGVALVAALVERDISQNRRKHAVVAEATSVGVAHLQTDRVSSTLASLPPMVADEDEERRRRQRRRDRQRTHDDVAGDEGLADTARALALSSSASLAEFAIAADDTTPNFARRAAFAAERAIAMERAQFDETTDFAANAANTADLRSAQKEEHADERPYIEYDFGADRSANGRDDRSHSGATRDDEQVAKESDGRARKSAGADEDAERATAARRDMGGAPNPAGGYPARDLGESRSGAGRSHPEAYREMRPVSEPSSGVRGTGASSDRQAGDQPPFAGLSRGAPVPAGARRHDVQLVSANAGRADGSGRRVNQPNATANELTAKHRLGLQQESDRLRTSALGKGIAAAVARPEPGASRSVAASSERAASKPISRPDVHTDSASSNAVDHDQTARLDSIRAEIAANEQVAREIGTIRSASVGPPSRHAEVSPKAAASKPTSRPEARTERASSAAVDRDQAARLDSIRADIAASEQVAREIEKIRAGGASPPPRNAEASPVAAPSNPISPPEVHFDNAPPGASADRKQVTSVEPIRAEGKNSRAGSAPRQAEAVVLPAPQAPASAEPPPPAKRDGDKLAPPTKEGPIIAIGGRALNNKVLQRKPPVWGR
jgi:hypothetical protein